MTPKIALDPHMYHGTMSVADELRHAADLGYSYLELSPRADWFFWQRYPKADDALIAETKKAAAETGVQIVTLVPVFNWSSPDEQERQAQVRNWRRLLQIANDLECPVVNSEFSGDPNRPLQSEHAFYRSVEELVPDFERYGIGLNLEAHPYDFSETNDDAVQIVRGINKPWVNYVFCAPHAFHLSDGAGDVRRMMTYAGGKLQHVHVADCFNHRANVGNRYIINPPGVDARIHQHNEIGNGEVDWAEFFGALKRPGVRRHRHGLRLRLGGRRGCHPPAHAGARDGRARPVRRVGFGLAGTGRMGRVHAGNLAGRCAVAELACVYDADGERAAAVAAEYGVPAATTFAELVERSEAVAVATPTGSHAELTVTAAQAGRPVFCEKPLSLDRATTVATIEAVEAAGVPLQVGFHRRFDPDWAAAAARIAAGELGEVTLFRTSLRDMTPPDPSFLSGSGGFFVDVTVHDLDVARWLVGEVVEVTAHGAASDPAFAALGDIDTAVCVLRFANGALGVIDNSRSARYGYECSTEVMGTLATVRVEAPRPVEWRTPGQAGYPLARDFEERYPAAYAAELDAFARCVLDGTPPRVTGRDALAAFDLAVAATESWRTGTTVTVKEQA